MGYDVALSATAGRQFAALPRQVQQRLTTVINRLASDPRPPGCKKLTGKNFYRVRAGDYRVIYTVEDDKLLVLVVSAGHRRDIYRKL